MEADRQEEKTGAAEAIRIALSQLTGISQVVPMAVYHVTTFTSSLTNKRRAFGKPAIDRISTTRGNWIRRSVYKSAPHLRAPTMTVTSPQAKDGLFTVAVMGYKNSPVYVQ